MRYGTTPATHILKPPKDAVDGHVENEHPCPALTRTLRLPAAKSAIRKSEDEAAIVVERFDRVPGVDRTQRLHQEDPCQVLGLPPTRKYQNEGGPGCAEVTEAIRTYSGEPEHDAWTLTRAIMLNWIVAGTDGYAKKFSMLVGAGERARLAPLYDEASTLPYDFDPRKLKMATKIGGEYLLDHVLSRHWVKYASEVHLPSAKVLEMGRAMADT